MAVLNNMLLNQYSLTQGLSCVLRNGVFSFKMKNLNYKALIFIKSSQCVWSSLRYQDMKSLHKVLLRSFQARSNRSAGLLAGLHDFTFRRPFVI